jgi:hypothetical protein
MSASPIDPVTVDTILAYLQRAIEEKLPLAPSVWIDGANKLNVLLGDAHDLLCEQEQEVAILKLGYLAEDPKHNVSAAKSRVQITEIYKDTRKQELKVKRIEEFIRLAKLRGRLLEAELRGN